MPSTLIYALSDPETGRVRYIGKTSQEPGDRLGQHIKMALTGERTHRSAWVRLLVSSDVRPVCTTLEEVNGHSEDGSEVERRWIARLRADGADLTNLTDGGDGWQKGRPFSAEHRALLSKAHIGRKRGPMGAAHKERIAVAMRGKPRSYVRGALKGHTFNVGRKHTTESRKRMSEAQRRITERPWLSRPHNEERKARIAAALRNYWSRRG
jgi:hypothetical protein